jgi:hypothetical protein
MSCESETWAETTVTAVSRRERIQPVPATLWRLLERFYRLMRHKLLL